MPEGTPLTGAEVQTASQPPRRRRGAVAAEEIPVELTTFVSYLRLESHDPAQNRHLFYVLERRPSLWEDHAVLVRWGRHGTAGHTRGLLCRDQPEAQAAIARLIGRRLRRGYQVVARW